MAPKLVRWLHAKGHGDEPVGALCRDNRDLRTVALHRGAHSERLRDLGRDLALAVSAAVVTSAA